MITGNIIAIICISIAIVSEGNERSDVEDDQAAMLLRILDQVYYLNTI